MTNLYNDDVEERRDAATTKRGFKKSRANGARRQKNGEDEGKRRPLNLSVTRTDGGGELLQAGRQTDIKGICCIHTRGTKHGE